MVKSSQRGFTLIELVVVIVILGILAAFAVPRFARMDRQARVASVRGLEGSLRSANMLAHSLWLAAGNNPVSVTMDNVNIPLTNGYPTAATVQNILAPGSVVPVGNTTPGRFQPVAVANGIRFQLNGATNPVNCSVTYTWAGGAGVPAIVTPTVATMTGANGC